jgi:tetraacyldisaccharide 4'-kinase
MWYAVGVAFRNFCFAVDIKKQTAPHVTTFGVGNLACGGTGKTPHVEYLLRLLQDQYHVAYLSRGYRRQSKGFVLCEGDPNPRRLGDEATMIALKFPKVTVAVCERRVEGVKKLMAMDNPPQVIVLDDAYQHRYIKPTCNILLTDYNQPYFEDHILPFGDLREFRNGKERANMIIVTKVPDNLNPVTRHNIMNELETQPYQKVFFSGMEFGNPYRAFTKDSSTQDTHEDTSMDKNSAVEERPDISVNDKEDNTETADNSRCDNSHLLNLHDVDHCLVFTGVAHPDSLVRYLKQFGAVTERHFGDHHAFTNLELQQLRQDFNTISAARKVIITTEKDAARLSTPEYRDQLKDLPLYVMPIRVKIQNNPDFDFDKMILSSVKENISFLGKLSTTHLGF